MAAVAAAARHRAEAFADLFRRHQSHATFEERSNAFDRIIGFACSCTGAEQEFQARLTDLSRLDAEARSALMRSLQEIRRRGTKAARRFARRAEARSRALLHSFLSKEQRWELRASDAFRVRGQDGRSYFITKGVGGNVRLLEDGAPIYHLCVVPGRSGVEVFDAIPVYDLMLAQKVLIENDISTFLRTARARDLRTEAHYDSAGFLLDDSLTRESRTVVELPAEVMEGLLGRIHADADGFGRNAGADG